MIEVTRTIYRRLAAGEFDSCQNEDAADGFAAGYGIRDYKFCDNVDYWGTHDCRWLNERVAPSQAVICKHFLQSRVRGVDVDTIGLLNPNCAGFAATLELSGLGMVVSVAEIMAPRLWWQEKKRSPKLLRIMARSHGKRSVVCTPSLVLDSSAIRNHLFKGWAVLNRVAVLARTGRINLCIPWIVEREVFSGIETHVDELTGQESFLRGVRMLAEMSSEPKAVHALCNSFEALRPKICQDARIRFRHWIETSQAEVLPLKQEHTSAVFDAYFAGNAPFDRPKNREHLPDAFIYNAVIELAARGGEVWFLAGDGRLREAVRKLRNVRVYPNFHPLFADLQVPFDYEQQQALSQVLPDTEALGELAQTSLASELLNQVLRYGKSGQSAPPVIRQVHQVHKVSLDRQSIMHINDSALLIAFEADVLLDAAERSVEADEVLERVSECAVSFRGHFLVSLKKAESCGHKITSIELDDVEVGEMQRSAPGKILRSIAPRPEVARSYKEEFAEVLKQKGAGLVVVVGSTLRNRRLVAEHIITGSLRSHEVALLNFPPVSEVHFPHVECDEDTDPFWNKAKDVEAHVLGLSCEDTDWATEAIHFLTETNCFIVATMKSAHNRSGVVRHLARLPLGKNSLERLLAVAWIQEVTPRIITFAISQHSSWGNGTWESVLERDEWLARSSKRKDLP